MTADTPAQVREYLEREVVPYLPTSIRAVSFEVNAWLVTVHTFQHGMLDDGTYAHLESLVGPLERTLPERKPEPWQVTVTAHRVDAPAPMAPIGIIVKAERLQS